MKISYITQQTWEKVFEPENKEPSLTRESDYISIEELFAKFKANEGLMEVFKPIAQLSPDERDVLENGTDYDDLADADLVEQKEFIDDVLSNVSVKKVEKKEKESEPTQPKDEPEPMPDKASE